MKTLPYFARPLVTVAPRDLLLLEHLPVDPTADALEIGTGSGSSLLRFAHQFACLDGVDVCAGPINRLRGVVAADPRAAARIRLFAVDFCGPDVAPLLGNQYDLIYSCDTLEHVTEPGAFFKNVYRSLKANGHAFVTFPNEHPSRAHGITYFERKRHLQALLHEAGFGADNIQVHVLRMTDWPRRVLRLGWDLPRNLVKKGLHFLTGQAGEGRPQTFDKTDFFSTVSRLETLAPLVNAYSWLVLRTMYSFGPVFKLADAPDVIWDQQVLIRATKESDPSFSAN